MAPYWTLFGIFAFAALVGGVRLRFAGRQNVGPASVQTQSIFLILGALLVALMIGFRYKVGGDWNAYAYMYRSAFDRSLGQMIALGDPAYQILTWCSERVGGGLLLVNLVCGALFSWGLYRLARIQPEPWLTMLVAVPYLIVVVAMGYSRQAVALGILMAGLARLMRGASPTSFLPYLAAATLFHKTAVIVLPLAVVGVYRQRLLTVLFAVGTGYFIYSWFLASSVGELIQSYVDTKYASQGAMTRVLMTTSAGLFYFLFRKRMKFGEVESAIWRNFSLAAFLLLVGLFATPSSTVIDRLALYLLPLQVAIVSRLSLVTGEEFFGRMIVIIYSAAVLFVWLNYADNAMYWIPYRFYPI